MRTIAVAATLLVLVLFASSTLLVVDASEHAVVTRFGRPTRVTSEAGLYFKLPTPIERVQRIDRRILFTETGEVELLTKDKKNVVASTYLGWKIVDPLRFLAALRSRELAEARLIALVQSELGSALGHVPFTDLVPAPDDGGGVAALEASVHERAAQTALRDYGIELVDLGLTRLNFPTQNMQSVFARMRAERERIARRIRSEGEAEAQKIRAEADRERDEILANAEADAARLRGEGEAEAARVYAEAFAGHEDFYRFLRTLESYEKILDDKTTLVLPADSPLLELLSAGPSPSGSTRE